MKMVQKMPVLGALKDLVSEIRDKLNELRDRVKTSTGKVDEVRNNGDIMGDNQNRSLCRVYICDLKLPSLFDNLYNSLNTSNIFTVYKEKIM